MIGREVSPTCQDFRMVVVYSHIQRDIKGGVSKSENKTNRDHIMTYYFK